MFCFRLDSPKIGLCWFSFQTTKGVPAPQKLTCPGFPLAGSNISFSPDQVEWEPGVYWLTHKSSYCAKPITNSPVGRKTISKMKVSYFSLLMLFTLALAYTKPEEPQKAVTQQTLLLVLAGICTMVKVSFVFFGGVVRYGHGPLRR